MPDAGQPSEKGGYHEESVNYAKKMQVTAILERLAPKLDEVNDISSLVLSSSGTIGQLCVVIHHNEYVTWRT